MKKNFKNLTLILLSVAMIFSIAGCSNETPATSDDYKNTNSSDYAYNESTSTYIESEDVTTSSNESSAVIDSTTETTTTSKSPVLNQDVSKPDTNINTLDSTSVLPQTTKKKEDINNSKSESETKNTTPMVTDSTTSTVPTVNIPKFTQSLNQYEYKNIEKQTGSDDYVAWMTVYLINDNSANITDFKNEFKTVFGFTPTANIQSKYLGEFMIDGYTDAQKIYQYSIEDNTYPLITDEFYVIKKKICADGSGWCGFPVPCSMDNMDNSQRVQNLLLEMRQMFCEWYGIDYSYVTANSDKFMTNMISEAGLMRTEDGRVLDVIYRYIRGINMPI